MSRLFISHSSRNDDWAIALRDWLVREGWSAENDIFLDLDPERGIVAGERWVRALEEAATRCEAVLYLVSEAWLASKWCWDEYQLAKELNKKLFALLIDDVLLERLPGGLTAQWQVVHLKGEPSERFLTVHPRTQQPSPVHIAKSGLVSLKRGLEKAGIGAETFELQPDRDGPFGWRAVYRGLEALEPQDPAVFFGRNADMVRGIDALRGLAARKPPRLLVILGASGAGKSSFLRAGLWPRLLRDDSLWLPLKAIRASRGGAIEGGEGLLAALEDVHARFAMRTTRAALRETIATPAQFVALLQELTKAAGRRARLDELPFPLPVLCLDQGEELFAADAGPESAKLLALARAAIDTGEALLLVTIRSDAYARMQDAQVLAGIDQVALPLGPVPQGEIGRIIREPGEVLRRKVGPQAPAFDPAVVEQLQHEIAGEADALPLLAFVLQRLMREHAGQAVISIKDLKQTGGVAAAIEREAEAALADAGYGQDRAAQREVLRRLFIPRLARIDRESKAPQRRVAYQRDLPADLAPLARALTERRLLVARMAGEAERGEPGAVTLEVAHEAMLRCWPTLADLLAEDRDALLMLDGVLIAANDWGKAEAARIQDFLAHRGSRLADARALSTRGLDWAREILPAEAYLAACQEGEAAEREEKEAALARVAIAQERTGRLQLRARHLLTAIAAVIVLGIGIAGWLFIQLDRRQSDLATKQTQLDRGQVDLIAEFAMSGRTGGSAYSPLRLAAYAAGLDFKLGDGASPTSRAPWALAAAFWQSDLRVTLSGHDGDIPFAVFSADSKRVVTASSDETARIWDTATGNQIAVLHLEAGATPLAVSSDGERILTKSRDQTASVWNFRTGTRTAIIRHTDGGDGVIYASLSPDGERVLTTQSGSKTARLWNSANGQPTGVLQHNTSVESARFSTDGKRVVTTASNDRSARLWDTATGGRIALLLHDDKVTFADFSPDGRKIVTTSDDKTARLWDAITGKSILSLRAQDALRSAEFSPAGNRVVARSYGQTAPMWDAVTGKQIADLKHNVYLTSVTFSPDGRRVVTSSADGKIRIWDATTGASLGELPGPPIILDSQGCCPEGHSAATISFNPNGTQIVAAFPDKVALVWDAATSQQIASLPHDVSAHSANFSPDGKLVLTLSDERARIWAPAGGKPITTLLDEEGFRSAEFSPDGQLILTTAENATVRIWDKMTGRPIVELRHDKHVSSATFSPKGDRVATTVIDDNSVYIWESSTGKRTAILQHGGKPSVMFSRDGDRILTIAFSDATGEKVRVWNTATGQLIASLKHGGRIAKFSPDGNRILTTAYDDNTVRIWAAATGRPIATLQHESTVDSAAFSADGNHVVTVADTTQIWDAATGKATATLQDATDSDHVAFFSPDGRRLVTKRMEDMRVWDIATGQEFAIMKHGERIESVAFSPGGNHIVTVASGAMRIWDAATGKPISISRGEPPIAAVAFSPDGRRILTKSNDEFTRIWDTNTGKQIAILPMSPFTMSAALSPDGRSVITGGWGSKTARIWNVESVTMGTANLLAEVCQRTLRGFTTLTHDEILLLGYDGVDTPVIDACASVKR